MRYLKFNVEIASGLLFAAFGGWFSAASFLNLSLGNAFRMGPGFFPAIVGGLLFALGLMITIKGWREECETVEPAAVPWRGVVLLPVGLILFGAAIRPLGLGIALLMLCFCSAMSVKGMTLARAAVLSAAITALSIAIFHVGLGLNLPLLGDWLR